MRDGPREERLDLFPGVADGGRRGDDLRLHEASSRSERNPSPVDLPRAQRFDHRLVETGHGAERAGDQVQLVLDDEIGRRKRTREPTPAAGLRGSVESCRVIPVGAPEQRAGITHPWQRGELVHGGDQERGQAPVKRLVHGDDGEWLVAGELALPVGARDAQIGRLLRVRQQREGVRGEVLTAPRTALHRNGRRPAPRIVLVLAHLGAGRVRTPVALRAEVIGCARLAHPQTDLERPFAEPAAVVPPALQLQRADQPGRAPELIEGQQTQGVAHDDADACARAAVLARVAEPPQDHGERREAEIRLGLAAAGGEEQQVHEPALGIGRIGDAGEIQQDEGELKGPPARRTGGAFACETAREGGGHGAIRGTEGVERVRIGRQHPNAALHSVRGNPGHAHELPGHLPALAGQATEPRLLVVEPCPIPGHEWRQRRLGRGAVGERAERLHVEHCPRGIEGLRLLDLGGGRPGGAEHPAGAVHQLPVRGDPVAGRELGRVGVVQIRHALVPVIAGDLAGVGSRDERYRAPHLDLGLEGERLVALAIRRRDAVVHQEQGHGTRSGRDPPREARGIHRTRDCVENQPAGIRNRVGSRIAGRCRQGHRHGFFARSALPPAPDLALAGSVGAGDRLLGVAALAAGSIPAFAPARALVRGRLPRVAFRSCFAALPGAVTARVAALRLHPAVVAPADEDLQRVDSLVHEEAQPHGRGEEALLRGPAVFGGVIAEPRPFRHLGLVVHVRVAALLDRRSARDEKSGEVPVGRPLPAPQSLVGQRMAGPRADEVEPERVDDRLAHFGGFRGASHVTSTWHPIAATMPSPTATTAIGSSLTGT